jgi:serine/threonine protein phosphatase PrpC
MKAFQAYGCTHIGNVRKVNEDHILLGRFIKNSGGMGLYFHHNDDCLINCGMIFAVADGIGGEKAGDVASRMALNALERQFYSAERVGRDAEVYSNAVMVSAKRANDTILQAGAAKPELSGMGCTIAGICLTPSGYIVFSAGDSRVYRLRNNILKPLTDDDTLTNIAVRAGQMNFAEAAESESRHTITNSLGSPSFNLKITPGPELRDNDIILICSDGLHDMVPHDKLETLMSSNNSVEQIALTLRDEALQNDGYDNISIILIRSDVFEDEAGWRKAGIAEMDESELSLDVAKQEAIDEATLVATPSITEKVVIPEEQGIEPEKVAVSDEKVKS